LGFPQSRLKVGPAHPWRLCHSDTAVAVYHDGSDADDRRLSCFREQFAGIGNRLFVFKWKNPEHWLSPMTRRLWQVLGYLRSLQPG